MLERPRLRRSWPVFAGVVASLAGPSTPVIASQRGAQTTECATAPTTSATAPTTRDPGTSAAPGDDPATDPAATAPSEPATPAGSETTVQTAPDDASEPPPVDEGSTAEALGRLPKRVKCLDESLVDEFGRTSARKGVQPRTFRKARRLGITIGGGVHAGDLLDTQWQVGGRLEFWPTEEFGFDGEFRLTPMTLRLERAATNAVSMGNRYPDGVAANLSYTAMGHLLFAPIHTKLRARKDRIVHGDFVLLAGAGAVLHRTVQAAAFDVGMSLYLFPRPWLSVRFDLIDQILAQEALGSRRISNNLIFSVGVGFWVPPRARARRRQPS